MRVSSEITKISKSSVHKKEEYTKSGRHRSSRTSNLYSMWKEGDMVASKTPLSCHIGTRAVKNFLHRDRNDKGRF